MKASFEWIKEFVEVTAPAQEVADRLTMAGLEIEGMEQAEGDTAMEVNVTPNRPDCLNILGIAREVAAAFDLPLRLPDRSLPGGAPESGFPVEIADADLCGRYTGRVISGTKVTDTPSWISTRLERCGIRSLNNNIVDITNYVLLELGHPLHAFDADRLSGKRIRVARAGEVRTIRTLDSVDRKVPKDALLIWDASEPVAIAGVMGGMGSSVTASTTNIFLESAYFEPFSIRRTSKALGLRSESSYRFERGTDIEFLVKALDRAALLIRQTGGGTIHSLVDAYPVAYVPEQVIVSYDRVNRLLGTDISGAAMAGLLRRIGIPAQDRGDHMLVTPPPFRRDIRVPVDVAEEVARLHGFGSIAVRIPRTPLTGGAATSGRAAAGGIGEAVRRSGFTEVINYSFMNVADLDMLGIPPDDMRRRCIGVRNPLRQEDGQMRTTLIPALINNMRHNVSRGVRDIRFYEMARVFTDEGGQLPRESGRLAGISFREDLPVLWKTDVPPFFVVKGCLEALFGELKLGDITYTASGEAFLHPGKSADIRVKGRTIGYLGELAPAVVERLDLKTARREVVVFELDLDALLEMASGRPVYSSIPRYPSVERDIAVIMDDAIAAAEVAEHIKHFNEEFVEAVQLFDVYKGKHVPEGRKSLAFRIVYRSMERTLTDAEVESLHAGLVDAVLKKTGGTLRSS